MHMVADGRDTVIVSKRQSIEITIKGIEIGESIDACLPAVVMSARRAGIYRSRIHCNSAGHFRDLRYTGHCERCLGSCPERHDTERQRADRPEQPM